MQRANITDARVQPDSLVGRVDNNWQSTRDLVAFAAGESRDDGAHTMCDIFRIGPFTINTGEGEQRLVNRTKVISTLAIGIFAPFIEPTRRNQAAFGADGTLPGWPAEHAFALGMMCLVTKYRIHVFGISRHESPFHAPQHALAILKNNDRHRLSGANVIALLDASRDTVRQHKPVAQFANVNQCISVGHVTSIY